MGTTQQSSDYCHTLHSLSVEVAVIRTRLEAASDALRLQAREYERRLELLNHAYQRADEVAKIFVTKEMHDQLYEELGKRIDRVATIQQDVLKELAARKGSLSTLATVAAIIISGVGLLVAFWHNFWIASR